MLKIYLVPYPHVAISLTSYDQPIRGARVLSSQVEVSSNRCSESKKVPTTDKPMAQS